MIGRKHEGGGQADQPQVGDAVVEEREREQGLAWGHSSARGIGSASAARPGGAGKGSAKYWVSCVTRPSATSITLTDRVGTPS
jgi:hypothetical protein